MLQQIKSIGNGVKQDMFFEKKKVTRIYDYNPDEERPVIRSSICTGEQVAGFKDKSGHFTEIMLIKDSHDLDEFMELYNVAVVTKEY